MAQVKPPTPVWLPDPLITAGSQIELFRAFVNDRYGVHTAGYAELHRWSTDQVGDFWSAVWDFFDVVGGPRPETALADASMPGAEWFPGAKVNYVSQIFRHRHNANPAIIDVSEAGEPREISWEELYRSTGALQATLQRLGVGQGDRVVGYLPNRSEAIIAMLATTALGAIWSVCAPDYSASSAADRFAQLEPKIIFVADGYRYSGRIFDRRRDSRELINRLPSLTAAITVRTLGQGSDDPGEVQTLDFRDCLATPSELSVLPVAFDHPLWVLFTSGTTGAPKGIVHGHGGVILEHLALLGLHNDLRREDVFFWYTTTNWMMWNLVVSGLMLGATIITYDGNPLTPTPDRLWDIVSRHRVTLFGTSPGYLLASQKAALHPSAEHDLSALRALGSTGSVLPPSAFQWAHDEVGPQVQVGSSSGGTELVGAFVGPTPTEPVWPGEISTIFLGVALESWDLDGEPGIGRVGELVITKPMPSMPLYFWNDPDGTRYREAYFVNYPGVWRHGDWITVTERGSVIIHGRSDATLNRHGVRFGSADIYDIVEKIPQISEALVVGVEEPSGDYWMPLFIVTSENVELDDALCNIIREALRRAASPRHVPDQIIAVPAIPHTRTGKKLEVPIKQILQGNSPADTVAYGAVDNPELLDYFAQLGNKRRDATTGT